MSVQSRDFVKVLEQIGIDLPRPCARATIRLEPGKPVMIECEVIMESVADVTGLADTTTQHRPSRERVTKKFMLVDADQPAPPEDVGGIVRRGI